jgi:hypothetical protein
MSANSEGKKAVVYGRLFKQELMPIPMCMADVASFMAITGTSDGDARRYLSRYPDVQVW